MPLLDSSFYLARVWLASTRASLVREMAFRANFVAGIIRQLIWLFAFIMMIEIVFANTDSLGGWQRPEVLIILALSRTIEGLMSSLFIHNLMELPQIVRDGKFDFHLTKPVPSQFYTTFRKTNIEQFGTIFGGILLFIYALSFPTISINLFTLLVFSTLVISGISIYYSLLVIFSTLVFYLDRLEFLWSFNTLLSEPLTVPFDIFHPSVRTTLTYLVPVAFVVFVPAQSITSRLHPSQLFIAIALAIIFITLANLTWRMGLRHYSSASS